MNARARHARAVIRGERRRRREGRRRRSLAAQKATGLWLTPSAARLAQLMQHWALGDGIAYVPHDGLTAGATGPGKTYLAPSGLAPVNGAYWVGGELDQGDAEDDVHTWDHACPECGPCKRDDAAAEAWGDPAAYACDCCGCEEDERQRREEDGTWE